MADASPAIAVTMGRGEGRVKILRAFGTRREGNPVPETSVWARLRGHFLAGLVTLLPFAVAVFIIDSFLVWATHATAFLSEAFFGRRVPAPGLVGLIIALVLITLVGMVAKQYVGGLAIRGLERLLARVPVWQTLYDGVKQVLGGVLDPSGRAFQRVVLVPGPTPGGRVLGFVVGENTLKDGTVSVFVPLSPPTGGVVMLFRPEDVEPSGLSVEEAVRVLISAGTLPPRRAGGSRGSEA